MKRTKEAQYQPYPNWTQQRDNSGCTYFFGEDNNYDNRLEQNKQIQKEWLLQQMQEKAQAKQQQAEENKRISDQILLNNKIRGILQSEHDQARKEIRVSKRVDNSCLAMEKKNREQAEKQAQLDDDRKQLELLSRRGQKLV